MPKFTASLKLFEELGYTVWFIRDTRLITIDHQIPIGCNTFIQASRASSHDVSVIKKLIKIFPLTCNWSITSDAPIIGQISDIGLIGTKIKISIGLADILDVFITESFVAKYFVFLASILLKKALNI